MRLRTYVLAPVLTAMLATSPPMAASAEETGANGKPSPEAIARWVRGLDAETFSERKAASEQLARAGREAFEALGEAALGVSRERSVRAMEILARQFDGGDYATRAAAEQTLRKIAATENTPAAARARRVLDPQPMERGAPRAAAPPARPAIQAAQIRLQAQAGGGGKRIRWQVANGNKELEMTENDRTVKIRETAGGKVTVEVTEEEDGKETTKKYEAENVEKLQQKHPEAHKLYKKHFQGPGAVPNRIQMRVNGAAPARRAARGNRIEALKRGEKQLEQALERMRAQGNDAGAKAIERSLKRMQEARRNAENAAGAE